MENILPVDTALNYYEDLKRVKPVYLQTKYPFSSMDDEEVIHTLKQIELVYQNLTPDVDGYVRKGTVSRKTGGGSKVIIFTM
jgi:hypothetical protein